MPRYLAEHARIGRDLTLCHNVLFEVDGRGTLTTVLPDSRDSTATFLSGVATPGFVDCHVHLGLTGGEDPVSDAYSMSAEEIVELAAEHAREHLRGGVTTVRDLGMPQGLRVPVQRDGVASPRIVASGGLTIRGGHGSFVATEIDAADEAQGIVDAVADAGLGWLKVFATGGVMTEGTEPGESQFEEADLRRIVKMAHRHGIRVAAHAHGRPGIEASLNAGVDTIEHASHADDRLVDALARAKVGVVATLVATERFVAARVGGTEDSRAKIRTHAPLERDALDNFVRAGVQLGAGTDAGTTANPHTGALSEQARLLEAAGMTRHGVLATLTGAGADLLGINAGYLMPGRLADWVILSSDPVENLDCLSDVQQVYVNGLQAEPG